MLATTGGTVDRTIMYVDILSLFPWQGVVLATTGGTVDRTIRYVDILSLRLLQRGLHTLAVDKRLAN